VFIQNTNGEKYPVDVQIPRGVRPNSTIKYPELGDNFFNSLPRGDLYVRITVEPDQRFLVENYDLIKTVEIDCIRSILGSVITVQGLDNKSFDLTIPPGTQPHTKFRIANQGLYVMNQSSRGNLIVSIKITVPTNLSQHQIDTLKEIFYITQ
jgi:molecular chaperone DnaJ